MKDRFMLNKHAILIVGAFALVGALAHYSSIAIRDALDSMRDGIHDAYQRPPLSNNQEVD